MADQGLISLANLMMGLFLIRFASKEAYGLYGIGYAVVLAAVGIANALVLTQMTVKAQAKAAEIRDGYCAAMLRGLYCLFGPVALLAGFVVLAAGTVGALDRDTASFAIAVAAAALGVLLLEFFRRLGYLRGRAQQALWLDLGFVGLLFAALFFSYAAFGNVSQSSAIIAYGSAAALAGGVAFGRSGLRRDTALVPVRDALRESWSGGRWALLGVVVTWLQSQSYVYLLGTLVGPSGVAEANAARLFMAPVALVIAGVNQVFLPRLAYLRAEGGAGTAERMARQVMWVLLGLVGVYSVLALAFEAAISGTLFTAEYAGIHNVVAAWAAVFLLQSMRANTSILLQAHDRFRGIALANVVSTGVVIAVSLALISRFGVVGAVAALAIGELVLGALLWKVFLNVRRNG